MIVDFTHLLIEEDTRLDQMNFWRWTAIDQVSQINRGGARHPAHAFNDGLYRKAPNPARVIYRGLIRWRVKRG
jgi:hypothetical protein